MPLLEHYVHPQLFPLRPLLLLPLYTFFLLLDEMTAGLVRAY